MKEISQYEDLIIKLAEQFRVDANLIRAIMMTESSGITTATRFEPLWHLFNNPQSYADHLGIAREEEERSQATSWGLMQVMGAVARDLGFTDRLQMLLVPDIGTFYGCKKLQHLMTRYDSEDAVIAAYNAGSARKTAGGLWINEQYVDKVSKYLRDLRGFDH